MTGARCELVDLGWTVNEVLRVFPASMPVFVRSGVDTCCGGDDTLAEAAARDGIDPGTLLRELRVAAGVR